jgi:hypothetical protein
LAKDEQRHGMVGWDSEKLREGTKNPDVFPLPMPGSRTHATLKSTTNHCYDSGSIHRDSQRLKLLYSS